MGGFNDWSTTAASNASVGGMNFAEGQLPSTLNNSNRQMAADLRYELGAISSTISAGATVDIGATPEHTIVLSGNATISSFGTTASTGLKKRIRVTGTPTLAHSVGAITVPGSANLTLAAGDQFEVECEGSGQYRVYNLSTANASPPAITQVWKKGANITSAATLVLGTDGNKFNVTGSAGPITAMTVAAGTLFMLTFNATPTLTHHSTNLILPGATDITAAAGDRLIGFANAANQVEVLSYTKADGTAIVAAASGGGVETITAQTNFPSANSVDITNIPQTYTSLVLKVIGASSDTGTRTLRVLLSTDNGSSWSSNQINGFAISGTTVTAVLAGSSAVVYPTIPAANNASFVLSIPNYRATVTNMQANGNHTSGSVAFTTITSHQMDGAINAIRMIWDSTGNFDAGHYTLYGVQ